MAFSSGYRRKTDIHSLPSTSQIPKPGPAALSRIAAVFA